jgi:hypothetical protein
MSRSMATASSFDFLGPDPLVPFSTSRPRRASVQDDDCDRDIEKTLTLSREDRNRILASAFATTDDEPTVELPAPSIPEDVPSPISVPRPVTEDAYGPTSTPTVALPSPAAMRALAYGREPRADIRTHALVIGIWSVAIMMASALLAYAMQT